VKDSEISGAANNNLELHIPNARIIGNIITSAGNVNLHYMGDEITIANNMIEEAVGDGIFLDGTNMTKIVGNEINHNGNGPSGGYGLRVAGAKNTMITGNMISKNDTGVASGTGSAQVYLVGTDAGPLSNLTLTGNTYVLDNTGTLPDFQYDAKGATDNFSTITLYETAISGGQGLGAATQAAQRVFNALGAQH